MIRQLRNNSLWIIGICLSYWVQGQSFHHKAAVATVDKAGFYAIPVTSDLSSYTKKDFSDLRIIDDKFNPVPYLLKTKLPLLKPGYFKPFKILSNILTDSGKTVLILENIDAEKINEISLRIKNTEVSRSFDISGSDDKIHWFSIVENMSLGSRYITDKDSYIENIGFPLSGYRYFRIIIYNGKNDPLNIIAAGRYLSADSIPALPLIDNPTLKYTRKDSSDHASYINVFNPRAFHIDHISLLVKGPKFFRRHADVFLGQQAIGNFIIATDSVFHFSLPVFNDSVFLIKIYNDDNPPLDIAGLSTAQGDEKIIAYLEPGKKYQMEMTNATATVPHYDLEDFKDSIPVNIPELKFSDIEPIVDETVVKDKSIFTQVWIWPVMVTVLLVLVLFTARLTKEVGKKP
ncbi:MAG: hypothetical protein JST75_08065 [Bacteroidetes bacterium]|nr:hypothetical protein [Bacteroidota bacterium]